MVDENLPTSAFFSSSPGEALMGDDAFGINRDTIVRMVDEIAEVTRLWGRGCRGHWRRQHLPWHYGWFSWNGPCHCRLHGHASHGQ